MGTRIPSSSSHALIGGLVGAGMAKAGISAAVWSGLIKTLLAIVLSPLVGFLLALVLVAIVSWAVGTLDAVRGRSRFPYPAIRLGVAVFAGPWRQRCAEDHGDHRGAAVFAGHLGADFSVPFWVVLSCQAAMALGALTGGLRIVRTMGLRITKLTPMQGFWAATGGAATLFMAT